MWSFWRLVLLVMILAYLLPTRLGSVFCVFKIVTSQKWISNFKDTAGLLYTTSFASLSLRYTESATKKHTSIRSVLRRHFKAEVLQQKSNGQQISWKYPVKATVKIQASLWDADRIVKVILALGALHMLCSAVGKFGKYMGESNSQGWSWWAAMHLMQLHFNVLVWFGSTANLAPSVGSDPQP